MAPMTLETPIAAEDESSLGKETSASPAPIVMQQEESQELQSMCMRCGKNGTTRLLLTKVPHFREIVLMAFECPFCYERNSEVQFAGRTEPRGVTYTLKVPENDREALNRQVVKADHATIRVPELDFEIPPEAQRGSLTTVEGLFTRAAEDLRALQTERRAADPQQAEALDIFLSRLDALAEGKTAFTLVLDDPSGNSFIENPFAPKPDPLMTTHHYARTDEQNVQIGAMSEETMMQHRDEAGLGLVQEEPSTAGNRNALEGGVGSSVPEREPRYVKAGTRYVAGMVPHGTVGATRMHQAIAEGSSEAVSQALFKYSAPEEVMTFPSTCSACNAPCETRMYLTNIPYFKEVIVMASTCDQCGYKNSELKPGGAIPDKGRRMTVKIKNEADLSRDVIKSDTASVHVPELELELTAGTLGGKVTTVEGLMDAISEKLQSVHGFEFGDSATQVRRATWQDFDSRLRGLLALDREWTMILEDPLANSFIAPATDNPEDDHQLISEEFERTPEQNEELGLNDMDTKEADKAYEVTTMG